jgi:hypothetical protein
MLFPEKEELALAWIGKLYHCKRCYSPKRKNFKIFDDDATLEDISDTVTCRLLCHLAVVRGINSSVVGMHLLLLLQLVRLSSVAWWLFWGCHEHALHHQGGEEAQTDK